VVRFDSELITKENRCRVGNSTIFKSREICLNNSLSLRFGCQGEALRHGCNDPRASITTGYGQLNGDKRQKQDQVALIYREAQNTFNAYTTSSLRQVTAIEARMIYIWHLRKYYS